MKKIILGFFNLFFTILGISIGNFLVNIYPTYWQDFLGDWVGATPKLVMNFLFGGAFYLFSNVVIRHFLDWYEQWTKEVSFQRIWCDFLGGVLGLIAGNLFFMVPYYFFYSYSLDELEKEAQEVALIIKVFSPLAINLVSFFIGVTVLKRLTETKLLGAEETIGEKIVADTNILIDGRIIELMKTGMIREVIQIHECVLRELQLLADSSDQSKRLRGRRGLENLEKMRRELPRKLEIVSEPIEGENVDEKLINYVKKTKRTLLTNDFNMSKIARLQLLECINLNEVSLALKPVLVPGEEVVIELVKPGKEHHQAVGYLEDGTMIVVENGRKYLGRLLEVIVTNIIQTQAGRIVFAKFKDIKKEDSECPRSR
ncbi:MAG: hypothetical protein PHW04_07275 [Candidatus Wallbacteria bacterium]|nr:hypothetical protein [Candidatus Wallbacteria bacterium]